MTELLASALPRKHFFLEMFTRDIALEECILDLVDNSIDGELRKGHPAFSSATLLTRPEVAGPATSQLPHIAIQFSESQFSITDDCGGIPLKEAQDEVFNFGYSAERPARPTHLGAYGIGLKRALFKIGRRIRVVSRTHESGFSLDLDVEAWARKDSSLDDWQFPISTLPASSEPPGTTITVTALREEVASRFRDRPFGNRLCQQIARTYMLFLNRLVRVTLNGVAIEPFAIPVGASDEVSLASDSLEHGDVTARMFAGLAARGTRGEWSADTAGWYVLCGGRAVVVADKTFVTGWGTSGFPQFHPKYRGFLGLVFFEAQDPLSLPWTTTKRGLNPESAVFQLALNRMRGLGRPVISFLDRMYPGEPKEDSGLRELAGEVTMVQPSELANNRPPRQFTWSHERAPRATISIQFEANRVEVDAVRKHLRRAKMSAREVGQHCLNYFLKAEGLSR